METAICRSNIGCQAISKYWLIDGIKEKRTTKAETANAISISFSLMVLNSSILFIWLTAKLIGKIDDLN